MICLKIRTFVVSATTWGYYACIYTSLWFAWKFVPLWYQQQPNTIWLVNTRGCDLLENSYLCGISNNIEVISLTSVNVVICLKIRTFVVSATTVKAHISRLFMLWFAWKFVPLWYQQQLILIYLGFLSGCDLLENSYLCGISNNSNYHFHSIYYVVICLKIRTFVVSATTSSNRRRIYLVLWFAWKFVPLWYQQQLYITQRIKHLVVICLKIRTFVVSATTHTHIAWLFFGLWFAWKFVPLWYQQQPQRLGTRQNTVVICLKIRTFVVSATTCNPTSIRINQLWFAWKFVPLWYQQQLTRIHIRTKISCDLLENSYLCGISNNLLR